MKFSVFNGMPYGRIRDRAGIWPVPNRNFEPAQAMDAVKRCLDEVELEDELGYDWIACAEHHYSPFNLAPNVTVLAATLVQRVKRAKIAILGALIPLTGNPVRIAEEYAMIDTLSGGRLIAGLLRGAPYEYLVYNVPPSESRSRFEEGWDLILRAWTDTMPFGWEGRHYHYRHVSIWPRPIQQPTPPIYVSGSSRESGTFAAKKRVGLGLAFTNLALAAEAARHYRAEAEAEGWTPAPEQIIYQLPVAVADTDAVAFDMVRPQFEHGVVTGALVAANALVSGSGFFGTSDVKLKARFADLAADDPRSVEEAVERGTMLVGGPDTVAKQVARLRREIGCGVLNLIFERGGPPDAKRRSIELFAREVMPQVRAL
ncbi:MAG TPA: LLM class flavin-dependent oxidoreductase [Stellaceae bacterium]|nr:LLM class flavin-dependent oxidoreductase [Stellaceae bacterium]